MGVAEQGDRALVVDGGALGAGDELVEQRERVSRRAPARADDERQHAGCDLDALLGAELLHVLEHRPGRHEPERVVVRARADGAEHLVGLGRREDELDVLGRLLDELEQRVEALRRHHVRLVEDEDLVAVACGGEHGALAQVAGVVDAVVARGVDLDDVERAAAAARELDAAGTHAARGVGGPLGAVEAPGEDAGRGGLAAAAWAAEQVGVIHPIGAERGHERLGHLRLSDHLGERLRPVAAIQGGDHASIVVAACDTASGSGRRSIP